MKGGKEPRDTSQEKGGRKNLEALEGLCVKALATRTARSKAMMLTFFCSCAVIGSELVRS